ncbi:MAG: hypothetical protein WC043_06190 [Pseudobdellovibrionaceae bacterium]
MKITSSAALRAAFMGAVLTAFSALSPAQAAGEPAYASPDEASNKLKAFCTPENMNEFKGHAQCLQETSGQVWSFAEKFHASLFTKQGIAPDAGNYHDMIEAWANTIARKTLPTAEQDFVALRNYAHVCHEVLQEGIFAPEGALSFSYTTGYNVPKSCVDTALHFAKNYGVEIDTQEAARLKNHISNIYKYYSAHPVIPPATKEETTPRSPIPPPSKGRLLEA